MPDFKNFEEWFRSNAPQDAQEKSDLLDALEEPRTLEAYSSRQNGQELIVAKGGNRVHLQSGPKLREAVSTVDNYDVYDEEDLDEGFRRAMDRPSND